MRACRAIKIRLCERSLLASLTRNRGLFPVPPAIVRWPSRFAGPMEASHSQPERKTVSELSLRATSNIALTSSSQPYRFFSRAWPWDLVLDVGSGDNPHVRADVLLDVSGYNQHRWGPLRYSDRLILCNGNVLPFANKQFDKALCSHCLEHSEDPATLAKEIVRVARSGIIEVPSPYLDIWFQPNNTHQWIFAARGSTLLYAPSPRYELPMPTLPVTVSLLRNDPLFRAAYLYDQYVFRVRIYWRDKLELQRVSSEEVLRLQRLCEQSVDWGRLCSRSLGYTFGCTFDRVVSWARKAVASKQSFR
jgi:SAM-dependent methyltransferase